MEIAEIRCVVSGKVQGVSYRNFVTKHARHLALVGYVRNLPNFNVEVVAQGYADKLEKLIEHARKGPFLAKVSNIDIEWREPSRSFDAFKVEF